MELHSPLSPQEARKLLAGAPGIIVMDDRGTSLPNAGSNRRERRGICGKDRVDRSVHYGLNMWVVADNIRKGAATNSIQIAELLI